VEENGHIHHLFRLRQAPPRFDLPHPHRGGIGVMGMDLKEGDYIEHLFITTTHHFLLFITSRGKIYSRKSTSCRLGQPAEQGPPRGQPPAVGADRDDQGGHRHQGLHRREVSGLRHQEGHHQERPASWTTRPRSRQTASSRSTSTRTTNWWPCSTPAATTT